MPSTSDHAHELTRYVTPEAHDPRSRFGLYRLCDCNRCDGKGKVNERDEDGEMLESYRCPSCRGEGRVRQEVASCDSPEAVGVALVTLAREGEWEECPFGLLDRMPECEKCEGSGKDYGWKKDFPRLGHRIHAWTAACEGCKGSGVKPTGTWLVLPWLPSPRNVRDAAKLLRAQR